MVKYILFFFLTLWLFSCRVRFNKVSNDLAGHNLKGAVKKVRQSFLNEAGDSAYCIQVFDSFGFLRQYYCDGAPYGGFEFSENYIVRHHLRETSKNVMGGGCDMYSMRNSWHYNVWGKKVKIMTYKRNEFQQKRTLYFDRSGRKTRSVASGIIETYKYTSGLLSESKRYSISKGKKLYHYQSVYEYDTSGFLVKVSNLYFDNGIFKDTVYTFYVNDSYGNMLNHRTWSSKELKKFGGKKSYEYDSMGNWTRQISMDSTGKVFHDITRVLEYYSK